MAGGLDTVSVEDGVSKSDAYGVSKGKKVGKFAHNVVTVRKK